MFVNQSLEQLSLEVSDLETQVCPLVKKHGIEKNCGISNGSHCSFTMAFT